MWLIRFAHSGVKSAVNCNTKGDKTVQEEVQFEVIHSELNPPQRKTISFSCRYASVSYDIRVFLELIIPLLPITQRDSPPLFWKAFFNYWKFWILANGADQ
jgi:hypothetical protein